MSCALGCARLLLITFNFIFWLSGVAVLSVGIWVLVDPNIQDYVDVINTTDEQYFKNVAYLLIALGSFVFLVGFCGCCGAIRKSKCLLGFYIFFLVVIFAGELAAGVLAAVYKNQIMDELDEGLKNSIKNDYLQNSVSWDVVQKELKCCGGLDPTDYDGSSWKNQSSNEAMIPLSCCILNDKGEPIDVSKCQTMVDDYHKQGCKSGLEDWVKKHGTILIGVGCGIASLQIFGLVFAFCLCRSLNEGEY